MFDHCSEHKVLQFLRIEEQLNVLKCTNAGCCCHKNVNWSSPIIQIVSTWAEVRQKINKSATNLQLGDVTTKTGQFLAREEHFSETSRCIIYHVVLFLPLSVRSAAGSGLMVCAVLPVTSYNVSWTLRN